VFESALAAQLDEQRIIADDVAKDRQSLLGKFRNAEHDVDGMKEHFDEEASAKDNLMRQLNKAQGESDMWRTRYEKDGVGKAEELEMARLKMQARFSEAESTVGQLNAKLAQVEKAKGKLQSELDGMVVQLDQAQILNSSMEKKAKQFDRIVGEWKSKVDGLSMDLDGAQKETRNSSSDLFKVKSAYEEGVLQLEEVRRENKSLSNEIKDIMDQISEGGRSIHEIDKIRKRLEAEKMELEAALSEAEGALEQEENKVLRAQLELTQVRQEIERRMSEKDEEFESTKKNMNKAIESMQAAVESESKAKAEANRMKKKLETDVMDLETAACILSMALFIFFLVDSNSSSFSDILRSISCLTWVSSSWARSTLFSSCSSAPSASDKAASSSIFSASRRLRILSISWMERPPSLI
jgi:myosin heavy subunit